MGGHYMVFQFLKSPFLDRLRTLKDFVYFCFFYYKPQWLQIKHLNKVNYLFESLCKGFRLQFHAFIEVKFKH